MEIKVLGGGCTNCESLEKMTREIVQELGIDAEVSKVSNITEILSYHIMQTPALVIAEKVVLAGKLPGWKELREIILKECDIKG